MNKKCFTIETRLSKSLFPVSYFEDNLDKQNRILRIVWKDFQRTTLTKSQYNTYLQNTYHIDKRTANTIINTDNGRLNALSELKKVECENLRNKIMKVESQISQNETKINKLKPKVTDNKATKKQLASYRRYKKAIWQKKQKLNRMKQALVKKENRDVLQICWGTKKLFKAQYYLKENGFKSHEGWLHAFRKKRDSQINFIGSVGEPKGNQNCQLSYDDINDSFTLKVRKDLEFMNDKNDKFFHIHGLNFKYQKTKLIEVLKQNATPLTFRILRRKNKWYLQVIFTWVFDIKKGYKSKSLYGSIGLDFNDGFIECSEIDYFGNLVGQYHYPLQYHGTGNKANSEMQEVISQIVKVAVLKEKPIVIENLDFKKTKAKSYKGTGKKGKQYNKMIHALDYARYKERMENATYRNEIELIKVNPAYTSRIGMEKYGNRMKLNRHQSASYVIARKGIGFKDRLEKR